ncbi:sigma-70 family RNA polymerase sigma factor [Paenibacillus sp. FSL L8-0708]|uniref:sigma-70 family RNA polymerase sigma factor n=1 Tax=Paenibacillus sp. FSL L8-0708 TaxID=2975311 RepID=UPI0030FB440B
MSKPIDYNPHLGYKDDVIQEHMRLVHSIANRYRKRCTPTISYEDLVSEGVIGMIKAFHKYDPTAFDGKVTKFSTFAVPTIQGEILRFLRERLTLVRTPRPLLETASKIRWKGLYDCSPEVIAETLEISLELAVRTLDYMSSANVIYLDQPLNSDGESEITGFDQMGDTDDLSGISIQEFMSFLKPREQKVLLLRSEGKSQSEIGEIIGKSQVQVSRILERIKPRLKKYMTNPESEEFMMKSEASTRKLNADEAKKYNVRSVLDKIEWFTAEISFDLPSVSLNSLGMNINRPGAEMMKLTVGDYIQVGYNSELKRLVLRKAELGIKLNKTTGKTGAVATNNKRIGKWLDSKKASRQRYALQFDETAQVHFIQLEAAGRAAGTA